MTKNMQKFRSFCQNLCFLVDFERVPVLAGGRGMLLVAFGFSFDGPLVPQEAVGGPLCRVTDRHPATFWVSMFQGTSLSSGPGAKPLVEAYDVRSLFS